MENKRITGFIICKGLEIVKKLDFNNKFISGEPAITYIEGIPYLITFAFEDSETNKGYVLVINMHTYEPIEIALNESLNIGFHSIFSTEDHD